MATYIKTLKEDNGDITYPQTVGSAVLLSGGTDLETTINSKASTASVNNKIDIGDVQSTDIVSGAVTTSKIDSGAVITSKIGDYAVTTNKIDAGAITTVKLGTGAVTNAKIDWGTIVYRNLYTNAGTAATGNFTLTDAIENYDFFDVVYGTNDTGGACAMVQRAYVNTANTNQLVNCMYVQCGVGTSYMYLKIGIWNFRGTAATCYNVGEIRLNSGAYNSGGGSSATNGNIRILRVVGYKYHQ